MLQREELIQQALALSPADRALVADTLEQSLSPGGFATPEIAALWTKELERRIDAYDRGELPASHLEASLESMRRHLAAHREGKVPHRTSEFLRSLSLKRLRRQAGMTTSVPV